MRTPQQVLADAIASGAVKAYINGDKIQVNGDKIQVKGDANVWEDVTHDNPSFVNERCFWRLKPTPKLRPWKPEEVPVGAWTKTKRGDSEILMICGRNGLGAFLAQDEGAYPPIDLFNLRLHSTDGGKTWHACGVMEGGE